LGWLVDPGEQTVLVYGGGVQVLDQGSQGLPVPEFAAGLGVTVTALFGLWLD